LPTQKYLGEAVGGKNRISCNGTFVAAGYADGSKKLSCQMEISCSAESK
jgi:hypothetical protein